MRINDFQYLKHIDYINWRAFDGMTVYITGATGLIGSTIIYAFLYCSNAKVVAQVRDKKKAQALFGDQVEYVICKLNDKPIYPPNVNYIIHCANPTSSSYFVNNPVETIQTSINGTNNILCFSREKEVKGFVLLSTMEVYGTPIKGHKVQEHEGGSFDSAVVRNCYPLSKQTCESLCSAYASEYGVHTRVVRLTQTFGPGVKYSDGRVFAEFARCAIEKRDIVLKTKGKTERDYLYTIDAVSAILTALLKGKDGEIYNAANEDTYCSIYEMAKLVAEMSDINVIIDEQDISDIGYANTLHMDLDTMKLRNLGWKPVVGLKNAYKYMIRDMEDRKNG